MFITLLHPMYVNHISPFLLVKRPFDIVVFQRHQQADPHGPAEGKICVL